MIWFVAAAVSTLAGAVVLLLTLVSNASAPQQAAGAAVALALSVLPYVFARCFQLGGQARKQAARHDDLLSALQSLRAEQPPTVARAKWD